MCLKVDLAIANNHLIAYFRRDQVKRTSQPGHRVTAFAQLAILVELRHNFAISVNFLYAFKCEIVEVPLDFAINHRELSGDFGASLALDSVNCSHLILQGFELCVDGIELGGEVRDVDRCGRGLLLYFTLLSD